MTAVELLLSELEQTVGIKMGIPNLILDSNPEKGAMESSSDLTVIVSDDG